MNQTKVYTNKLFKSIVLLLFGVAWIYSAHAQSYTLNPNFTLPVGNNGKTVKQSQPASFSSDPAQNDFEARLFVNLNLLFDNNSTLVADGIMVGYSNMFSSSVDGDDVGKFTNFYENLAIQRGSSVLTVECRPLPRQDTVFLKLWGTNPRKYQLQFLTENADVVDGSAYVEDAYLHKSSPLDLSGKITTYNFSVTSDPGSQAQNRFRLIYTRGSNKITAPADENRSLQAKATAFPNPVTGNSFSVKMSNLPAASYYILMYNNNTGSLISKKQVNYSGGELTQTIQLAPNAPKGMYTVKVAGMSGNTVQQIPVIVNK